MQQRITNAHSFDHSIESFKALLENLSSRGLLKDIATKFDLNIVSKPYWQDERSLVWAISTTPNSVMEIRRKAYTIRDRASSFAEITSIQRQLLDETYQRKRKQLVAEIGKNDSVRYVREIEQLNEDYSKSLSAIETGEHSVKHEEAWSAYLELDRQFFTAQQKEIRSIWLEIRDQSPGNDRIKIDLIANEISAKLLKNPHSALYQIMRVIVHEAVTSTQVGVQERPALGEQTIVNILISNVQTNNNTTYVTHIQPQVNASPAPQADNPSDLDDSIPKISKKYPLTAFLMPYAKKRFLDCWKRWDDDTKAILEKMLVLVKQGLSQAGISSRLSISQSAISKRLNAKDRCSLGMTMEEIRSYLSEYDRL